MADPRDRRYRGIRIRMINERDELRPHMRIFVNREPVASLDVPVDEGDEIIIMQALSGG